MLNLLAQVQTVDTATAAAGGAMVMQLVSLAVAVLLAVITYKKAKANNSDKVVLWTILSFFLGLIGYLIFYLVEAKNYPKK